MAVAVDGLARRTLFGLPFVDAPSLEPVLDAVLARREQVEHDALPVLVTPNVDILVQLERATRSVEARLIRRAQFVLPDGMPIVAASKLLGEPLSARLTGSGLFEILWPALVAQDRPVLVLCANAAIAERLGAGAPSARFVVAPYFDSGDADAVNGIVSELLAMVGTETPEFVLFGIGHPKDPVLAARLLERWPIGLGRPPMCCCLGASFAMYLGLKRRAPDWVQRAGLEWFYRFLQEPRRLFHRYFVRDVAFFGIMARAAVARARGGRS